MFQKVVEQLQIGQLPETTNLRQMLDVALTKKMGVLRMPYLCRSQDTKINPPAEQLLVVAAVLGDAEKIVLCLDILLTEAGQKSGAGRSSEDFEKVLRSTDGVLALLRPFPEERRLFEEALQTLTGDVCGASGKEEV